MFRIVTGVISGLNVSPLASADVGRAASTAFQSRSIVWLPMSPIWPLPKSQNMFHGRQLPRAAGEITRVVGVKRRRAEPQIEVKTFRRLPFGGQVTGRRIWRLPHA